MKLLLLAIAACFSASLQAQEINIGDKSKLLERAMQFKIAGKDTVKREAFNLVIQTPGSRVRILPQDGMPCIVPDTSDIAAMPNAFKKTPEKDPLPGRIPNAWKEPKPLPDFKGSK
ncbi:hypothetical protein SAMN05444008_103278 [Cnuella takakiae]|uniref:Uncharacterized protein n=1 Tax=Cnuella takakiae TaxID=1302690 RepID=A0A1M4X809_9BACT|nr:hypothetical protein [Cnuella takakiae]OLY91505.1 hypothetical protein BUE76_06015 [Cnuella takakiae]SHE89619.1 hypothetical protein SAMN05444008_103278 [Cnuella takakiae]